MDESNGPEMVAPSEARRNVTSGYVPQRPCGFFQSRSKPTFAAGFWLDLPSFSFSFTLYIFFNYLISYQVGFVVPILRKPFFLFFLSKVRKNLLLHEFTSCLPNVVQIRLRSNTARILVQLINAKGRIRDLNWIQQNATETQILVSEFALPSIISSLPTRRRRYMLYSCTALVTFSFLPVVRASVVHTKIYTYMSSW